MEHADGWALVLTGGGNRGAIQAGAVLALAERGVVPDLIVGVSVGALNGAYLAFHPGRRGAEGLIDIWRGLDGEAVFGTKVPLLRQLLSLVRHRSAFSNSGLRRLAVRTLPSCSFDDTAIPLAVVATHLESGTSRVLDRGDVVRAVLASAAIPVYLPPVDIDGELLVDGAIADPVPLHVVAERGLRRAVIVEPGHACACTRVYETTQSIVQQSLAVMSRGRVTSEIAAAGHAVDVIHLGLTCHADIPLTDFSKTDEMLQSGYDEANVLLQQRTIV